MTPTAVTHAGRTPAGPAHRRGLPSRTAPSAPRRVSGPLRGRTAQPGRAPRAPRSPRVGRAASATRRPLAVRFVEFVRALPDHALLDRVVRGRTWIALLGVMLVGIVAMQVEVLKLGASEGRALQESAALQSRNEILRAAVSSASSEQRIERLASSYGMVMPSPTDIVFLSPNESENAERAAQSITAPNATDYVESLPADEQSQYDSSVAGDSDTTAGDAASTDSTAAADETPTEDTTDTGASQDTAAPGTASTGGVSTAG